MSQTYRLSAGRLPSALLLIVLSVVAAGCSEGNPNLLNGQKLYPVKGKVILENGKPLTSGRVSFAATKSSITSTANIESDGAFTFKGAVGDGLPEGVYKIRFEAGSSGPVVKGAGGKLNSTAPFATKYLDEDSSELTATVTPEPSKNDFEFKLETHDPAPRLRSSGAGREKGR